MKKYAVLTFFMIVVIIAGSSGVSFCQDFPANADAAKQQVQPPSQQNPNQPFYGYVPPPPIRHTWPGGYKVIFHELLDTLMEHVLGQY